MLWQEDRSRCLCAVIWRGSRPCLAADSTAGCGQWFNIDAATMSSCPWEEPDWAMFCYISAGSQSERSSLCCDMFIYSIAVLCTEMGHSTISSTWNRKVRILACSCWANPLTLLLAWLEAAAASLLFFFSLLFCGSSYRIKCERAWAVTACYLVL